MIKKFITVLLISVCSQPATAALVKRIDAPCTACKAVAAELQRRINNEPIRNHLDLRHRLDKDGQRYGKVIAYRSSELRAVELLDRLCSSMRDYSLVSPLGKKTKFWLKVTGEGSGSTGAVTRPQREEEDEKSKRLESYCGSLIEEYEDEIYAGIMKGDFDSLGVESVLCGSILSPCPAAAPRGADGDSPTPAAESRTPSGDTSDVEEEATAEEAAAAASGYVKEATVTGDTEGNLEL